jgi:hypothetical protein
MQTVPKLNPLTTFLPGLGGWTLKGTCYRLNWGPEVPRARIQASMSHHTETCSYHFVHMPLVSEDVTRK